MKTWAAATLLIAMGASVAAQTPEATVIKFAKAVNARDFTQMAKLIKGANITPAVRKMFADAKLPSINVGKLSAKITGNTARVTMRIQTGAFGPDNETAILVKSGNIWLLTPEKGNRGAINWLVNACTTGGADLGRARSAAESTHCTSNLKQLALGVIMFTTDQDDMFKMTAANWQTKVFPYTKNLNLHKCQVTGPSGNSYSFNTALAGKTTIVADPANLVMLYEGKAGKLRFHPDGKAGVAFADGRVKRVTAAEAKKLRWKP